MTNLLLQSINETELRNIFREILREELRKLPQVNSPPFVQEDQLLSYADVCKLLHCSIPVVRQMVVAGELKSIKVGKRRRFLKSQLLNLKHKK